MGEEGELFIPSAAMLRRQVPTRIVRGALRSDDSLAMIMMLGEVMLG